MARENFKYDFTVIGGGLIGSLVSILLAKEGFKCCLIERNSFKEKKSLKNFNPLSLNYRTILILKKFGLWDKSSIIASPIRNLVMKCFNSLNRLKFLSTDINLEYLGYVVDKFSLHQYFIDIAKNQKKLDIFDESTISKLNKKSIQNNYNLQISSSTSKKIKNIESEFVILSDGQPSSLGEKLKFRTIHKDHNQTAFMVDCVANFETGVAVQLFNEDGIFALVPYSEDKTSLILTLNKNKKDNYIDRENNLNLKKIETIFGSYLKNITNGKIINSYELKTARTEEIIKENIMLLGNTSQLLHPVGAQGFNLGIKNIETIIDHLADTSKLAKQNISNNMHYIAEKIIVDREDICQMTDIATNLLANPKSTSRITSSLLISLLKISNKTKKSFLKRILGLNDCSYLTIKG